MKYYRAVVRLPCPKSQGVISLCSELCETNEDFNEIISWFNHYLAAPKKYQNPRWQQVSWWFKETATEHLLKSKELCKMLIKLHYPVYRLVAEDIKILYEDKFQVVVKNIKHSQYKIKVKHVL